MSTTTETDSLSRPQCDEPLPQMAVPLEDRFDARSRRLLVGVVGAVVAVAFEAIAVSTAMPVAARDLDGLGQYGLLQICPSALALSHLKSVFAWSLVRAAWASFTLVKARLSSV